VQRRRWFTVVDPDAELIARARTYADGLASVPRLWARLDSTASAVSEDFRSLAREGLSVAECEYALTRTPPPITDPLKILVLLRS
jgi:hypothetical protein